MFFASFITAAFLVICLVEFSAWRLGETVTPTQMAEEQQHNPRLVVLPPEINFFGALKMRRLALNQPDVVMIGSSRCNELRSAMMRPYKFYNACLSAWTFDQMYRALDEATTVAHPSIVAFTMDYSMFSTHEEQAFGSRNFDLSEGWQFHVTGLDGFVSALISHPRETLASLIETSRKLRVEPIDHMELLGAAANRVEAGFRFDGSFLYPRGMLLTSEKTNQSPTDDMQPGGAHVLPVYLDKLARMKALADSRHVLLVGIQLPFLATSIDYLDHDNPAYSGVWQEFETPEVRKKIEEIGVPFFDLARDPLTRNSRNFIDPSHPNEAGILAGLLRLTKDPQFLAIFNRLDVNGLQRSYDQAMTAGNYTDIYRSKF